MSQFVKDIYISEKKYQNICNLQDKTGCKKYVLVIAIAKSMSLSLSILIITKFKSQNLLKANNNLFKKLGSSHFLVIFCMPWKLSHLISIDFLFVSLFPCLSTCKENQNGACIFLLDIPLIEQSRDLIG